MTAPYDLCVVGGAGRMGAPLAILLASRGFRVLIHDSNQAALDRMAGGELGFRETEGEATLRAALALGNLGFTANPAQLAGIPDLIVAIATPLDEYQNPDTSVLAKCIDPLLPYLQDDVCLILRSTVAPGSIHFLERHLREAGRDLLLAYCPERVTEGHAIQEMGRIAQIVSGTSPRAVERARRLFQKIALKLVEMMPLEAEYAKLMANAYRYIQFAAANQFSQLLDAAGLDYSRLLGLMQQGYPRLGSLPRAGFAAGPCLRKDTLQLFAWHSPAPALGQVAVGINEGMPEAIVARLQARFDLTGKKVGLLGMAFKAESDDLRGSLSCKLANLLRFRGAEVRCSDEYVADPAYLSKEGLVEWAEVVIIAASHRAYRGLEIPDGKWVIDTCGSRGWSGFRKTAAVE